MSRNTNIKRHGSHGVDWTDQHEAYLGKAVKGLTDPAISKGS
jgi:hypothetical protein